MNVPRSFSEYQTKLQSSDFNGNVLTSPETIPVLFYAEWCPFCRKFYPGFETAMNSKGLRWAEADISDYEDPLWETFEINAVPTIIVFKDGKPVFRRDAVLGRGLSEKAVEETVQEMGLNTAP